MTAIEHETSRGYPISYATALWSNNERLHSFCPDYIYMQALSNPAQWDSIRIYPPTPEKLIGLPIDAAGRADNDVFYTGHFCTVLHYNGRTLHLYKEIQQRFPDGGVLKNIALTRNSIYIVGTWNNYAILVKGTKAAQ